MEESIRVNVDPNKCGSLDLDHLGLDPMHLIQLAGRAWQQLGSGEACNIMQLEELVVGGVLLAADQTQIYVQQLTWKRSSSMQGQTGYSHDHK